MFRILLIIGYLFSFSFATTNQDLIWNKGETLITFLINHNINKDVYFNLSKTDKELCTEIEAGIEYRLIKADNGAVLHTLIPISEEMQIHIYQDKGQYVLDIIPVIYETKTELLTFKLTSSPYQDIVNLTKNKHLANEFIKAFQKSINFKKVHAGDVIALKYEQKVRMGRYYGSPVVVGAFVRPQHQDEKYVFQNPDDSLYYDEKGNSFTSVLFKIPLSIVKITSDFTYKRFHPVLKYYRAHLGVDLAAPVGTKISATGDGQISTFGVKGGYGNTVIINHDGGFKSLYGHLSKFNKKFRVGSSVKQGDIIGFVGTSGVSSGPHLHFGMYKNTRAMDPMNVMSSVKKVLGGGLLKKYLTNSNMIRQELEKSLSSNKIPFKLDEMPIYSSISKRLKK
ncbi:MAG: peptidoglycan DD-metalloendopeptidase family protein [Arcobacter sp.]|nr:peptidoglycan DD-metalloendopeptidase family protein [Arcobacter sp.]